MTERNTGVLVHPSDDSPSFSGGITLIIPNAPFEEGGTLTRFWLNLVKHNEIFLQVWRPEGDKTFSLVYNQKVDTEYLPRLGRNEVLPDGEVSVEAGDRLGMSVQEGSLATGFGSSTDNYLARDFVGNDVKVGNQFDFEERELQSPVCAVAAYTV